MKFSCITRKRVAVVIGIMVVLVPVVGVVALEKMVPLTPATYDAGSPENTRIIWDDFDAFWRAVDASKQSDGTYDKAIFDQQYAQYRSDGLDNFDKLRYGGGGAVYDSYHMIPFYQSFRADMVKTAVDKQKIAAVFTKARSYYPQAPIANVRVFMGLANNGGTITNGDIIIAYEMFGDPKTKDWDKLDAKPQVKQYLQNMNFPMTSDMTTELIAHEYIHYLQLSLKNSIDRSLMKIKMIRGKNTLLDIAMNEGIATFLQSVLTGTDSQMVKNAQSYVDANGGTDVFLQQFINSQNTTTSDGLGDWLYTPKTSDGRPPDMGYYIGAVIAQKYWQKIPDKRQAFMDLIGKKTSKHILTVALQ